MANLFHETSRGYFICPQCGYSRVPKYDQCSRCTDTDWATVSLALRGIILHIVIIIVVEISRGTVM